MCTRKSRFTAEMAAAAAKVRLIHVAGAGTDKVEFDALALDVLVARTGSPPASIAEDAVAAAISVAPRHLVQDDQLPRWRYRDDRHHPDDDLVPSMHSVMNRNVRLC